MLEWARNSVSYDLVGAAKRIGIKNPNRLREFEKGTKLPTTKQLVKMSKVYDCPFAAFFFSKPPNELKYELKSLADWRSIPGTGHKSFSPELTIELRLALRRRDILLDLAEGTGEAFANFMIAKPLSKDKNSAEKVAQYVREQLQVTVQEQKRFGTEYNALRVWRNSVERIDVIVSQTGLKYSLSTDEMRGVAISYERLPIILINGKDAPYARIFTLMHELGHIVLREGGVSNSYRNLTSNSSEVFCNEFAGELLVPRSALLDEELVNANQSPFWEDDALEALSRIYRVSKEVILLRLLSLRRTNQAHYQSKARKWKREWEEKQALVEKKRGGARPPYEKFARGHGARFVSSVLEAYGQEKIHAGQLSEYLGAKLHYVPDIYRDLARVTA